MTLNPPGAPDGFGTLPAPGGTGRPESIGSPPPVPSPPVPSPPPPSPPPPPLALLALDVLASPPVDAEVVPPTSPELVLLVVPLLVAVGWPPAPPEPLVPASPSPSSPHPLQYSAPSSNIAPSTGDDDEVKFPM
ncbi:hypothetical protein [Sorangium sp. So ce394]|uniref:hypothetical protein n=1 Tax=Sorangium sp. So ce394 TaxID=3133310 RepID=UPI003F5B9F5C